MLTNGFLRIIILAIIDDSLRRPHRRAVGPGDAFVDRFIIFFDREIILSAVVLYHIGGQVFGHRLRRRHVDVLDEISQPSGDAESTIVAFTALQIVVEGTRQRHTRHGANVR